VLTLDCISEDTLVPIGIVECDPYLAAPTIYLCKPFHSDSGLKHNRPVSQLERFQGSRLDPVE
jgi:hypothetical protein